MSNVTAVSGATVAAPDLGIYRQPATPASESKTSLDKDAFLKLLVAQLKYQDPMKPSSSEDFIATTAQFTVVEKLDQLTQQGAATALVSSLTTASSLVGRTVSAIQNGLPIEATVQRSRLSSGEVVLETDRGVVRLNEIVSIGPSALAAATPPATPTPAAPADTEPVATEPTEATEPPPTPSGSPASDPPPQTPSTDNPPPVDLTTTEENHR